MGKKRRSGQYKRAVQNSHGKATPEQIANVDLSINGARLENSISTGIGGGSNYSGYPGGSPYLETSSTIDPLQMNLRYYLISNFRQFLNELYTEIGLIQTIVDVPVDDGLRGGIEIKTKQLDEEQVEELVNDLERQDDVNTVGQAAKWNRLFGGAGVLLLVKGDDPEEPLDITKLGPDTPLDIRAVDMWELFTDKQSTDGFDPGIQTPNADYYSYYGEPVHRSRVLILVGQTAPSFVRPRLRGWGLSVVEAIVQAVNQYERANNVSFEVLDEFKLDIYKIKNLVNTLMSPNGAQQVQQRIALANKTKSYQSAIVMDSEDDYVQKQLSFAGFADAMAQIRMQVAAALRMPLTKLFGISASGFNSGEDDIEVYNSMVESQVRNKIKYILLKVVEIRCQQLFGMIPDDLAISFKPLREMSSEQEQNVKTQKYNRLQQAMASGFISLEEFRDACNRGDLFDVKLDASLELTPTAIQQIQMQGQGEDEGEADAPDDKAIANEFKESDHPRADDGKFGEGGGKAEAGKSDQSIKTGESVKLGDYDFEFRDEVIVPEARRKRTGQISSSTWILRDNAGERIGAFHLRTFDAPEPLGAFTKIDESEIDAEHSGKGLGTKAYAALVKHYGTLLSDDRTLSDAAAAVWQKLGAKPATSYASELKESGDTAMDLEGKTRFVLKREDLEKKQNESVPYTLGERIKRSFNSSRFDKASYEADGGDSSMPDGRKYFFDEGKAKDKNLWRAATDEAKAVYGGENWKFTVWLYEKRGGVFNDDESSSMPVSISGSP